MKLSTTLPSPTMYGTDGRLRSNKPADSGKPVNDLLEASCLKEVLFVTFASSSLLFKILIVTCSLQCPSSLDNCHYTYQALIHG